MFDIETFRELVNVEALDFRKHFMYMISERGITLSDIDIVIFSGEIIEDYPDNEPDPAALLFGYTAGGKPLHVVVALGDGVAKLVTAYYPTLDIWEADYKTRKVLR